MCKTAFVEREMSGRILKISFNHLHLNSIFATKQLPVVIPVRYFNSFWQKAYKPNFVK